MMHDNDEELLSEDFQASLAPINFFQIQADCHYLEPKSPYPTINPKNKNYFLPLLNDLCDEESFGEIALAWNYEGIAALAIIQEPYQRVNYPDIRSGDSVELFIDTRDVKTSGFNTRFCHHFFFLPEPVEGIQALEITKFRTEDSHEMCNSSDLIANAKIDSKGYQLQMYIPSQCLHGFDPDICNHIGFTYRINRASGPPQHFSVLSDEFVVEQQPSLWSSLQLIKT